MGITLEFQKALPFLPNKINYPCYGQPKINGGRCGADFDTNIATSLFDSSDGMFKLRSKESHDLPVDHIKMELTTAAYKYPELQCMRFDGEIYKHGTKVTSINGAARNPKNPIHSKLQYVIFDLINGYRQDLRLQGLEGLSEIFYNGLADNHAKWPLGKVIMLETVIIHSDAEAKEYRDKYITLGFEGLILREINSFYTPGKHVGVMYKYKDYDIDLFTVVNIVPKPKDTHLPLFICQNDLTDETFEAVPTGTHTKQAMILHHRDKYIGTQVYVKYYERTINQLPFHANVLTEQL